MDLTKRKGFIQLHAFDWSTDQGKMRVVLALGQDWAEIDSIKTTVKPKAKSKNDKSFLNKVKDYAKAEASLLIKGAVDNETYENRVSVCMECEHLLPSDDPIGHCNECGCGTRKRAGLTVKCKMPEAICSKNKWKIEEK